MSGCQVCLPLSPRGLQLHPHCNITRVCSPQHLVLKIPFSSTVRILSSPRFRHHKLTKPHTCNTGPKGDCVPTVISRDTAAEDGGVAAGVSEQEGQSSFSRARVPGAGTSRSRGVAEILEPALHPSSTCSATGLCSSPWTSVWGKAGAEQAPARFLGKACPCY